MKSGTGMIETSEKLTRQELAWELVSLLDELRADQISEVLAKNVPAETLEFFTSYANSFGDEPVLRGGTHRQQPNLLLLGYLLRLLEERLISDGDPSVEFDA